MATPRPKRYVAVKPFSIIGGGSYGVGDEVVGRDLGRVLRFGDQFVAAGHVAREKLAEVEAVGDGEAAEPGAG